MLVYRELSNMAQLQEVGTVYSVYLVVWWELSRHSVVPKVVWNTGGAFDEKIGTENLVN